MQTTLPTDLATQTLFERYHDWLASPRPWDAAGSVAGNGVRRGLRQGQRLFPGTQAAWDELRAAGGNAWLWSDLHLGHSNILAYTSRTDASVEAMDERLLEAARARVGKDEWLLFLGDVSLARPERVRGWLDRCPGRKALILGNHDVKYGRPEGWLDAGFEAVAAAVHWELPHPLLDADGKLHQTLWLTHYPMWMPTMPARVLNLHGHIHDHRLDGPAVNACVEHLDMAPERLKDRLARWSAAKDRPREP